MGQFAQIIEADATPDSVATRQEYQSGFNAGPARLIPGSNSAKWKKAAQLAQEKSACGVIGDLGNCARTLFWYLTPAPVLRLTPPMLGLALLDVGVLSVSFWTFNKILVTRIRIDASSALFYVVAFLLFASWEGLYSQQCARSKDDFYKLARTVAFTTLLVVLAQKSSLSRVNIVFVPIVSGISGCFLALTRLSRQVFANGPSLSTPQNVLVVGDPTVGQRVMQAIRDNPHGRLSVKGFLPEQQFRKRIGPDVLRRLARQECIDEVIVATADLKMADAIVSAARHHRLNVKAVFGMQAAELSAISQIGNLALLTLHEELLPEWQLAFKRIADFAIASAGLLLILPLLLFIGLLIKLDSAGPVLYRSIRIGQRGRRFLCYKFRTMTVQADAEKKSLRSQNERQGAFFKIADDPRVTRVGKFLRRYSLDELPQLWNVLRGDMGLVGPRPHPPDDVEGYSVEDMQRLDFVPGMTGLWQVTARQDPSFQRCVALDVEYIKTWNPWLDLRILCRTIFCVLQGSGA